MWSQSTRTTLAAGSCSRYSASASGPPPMGDMTGWNWVPITRSVGRAARRVSTAACRDTSCITGSSMGAKRAANEGKTCARHV